MTDADHLKERIARAILKRRFYDCEPDMYGRDLERFFAEIDPQHMHDARDEVEAALDALYEPSEGVLDAAWTAAVDHLHNGGSNEHCANDAERSAHSVRPLYRAMIDHIRSEGKE